MLAAQCMILTQCTALPGRANRKFAFIKRVHNQNFTVNSIYQSAA